MGGGGGGADDKMSWSWRRQKELGYLSIEGEEQRATREVVLQGVQLHVLRHLFYVVNGVHLHTHTPHMFSATCSTFSVGSIYTRTHTHHTKKHTHAHAHIYMYTHTHTHTHIYIYIYVCTHSHAHTYKWAHTQTYILFTGFMLTGNLWYFTG